jgi:hypothetical protein
MKFLIFSTIILTAVSSFAVPKKYTKCSAITSPKGATGFYYNEDCSTAYVLPPKTGTIKLAGMTKTTSADICSGLVSEQKTLLMEQKKLEKKLLLATSAVVSDTATPECRDYSKKIARMEIEVETLAAELNSNIETINSLSNDSSPKAKSQVAYMIAKNGNIKIKIASLKKRLASLAEDNANCNSTNDKVESVDNREEILNQLSTIRENRKAALDAFKNYEGAKLQLIISDNHQEMVEAYSQSNRDSKTTFVKMPMDWSVAFNIKTLEDLDFKAILDSSVPAVGADMKISPISEQVGTSVFGGSLSSSIVLNLPATCFLMDQMKSNADITSAVSINAFYKYDLQTKRSYKAEYNLRYVYEFIKKITSKRGFFRSSSSAEVKEFIKNDKSFKLLSYSEDPDNAFPSDQDFLSKIRGNVLDLALQDLGGKPYEPPENQAAPEAGAKAVAGALSKCPNMYCQAGSIVLNLAHALFGSGTSSASYLKTVSDDVVEEVTDLRMVQEFGSMAFEPSVKK